MNKNARKQAKQGSGTDNPRQERKPEDRKPGSTADNVGKKDQAGSQEKRSDLADAGEATEQGGSEPTSEDDDQARGHRSMHAGKASLDEAETLAGAGADFIAVGENIWRDARAVATAASLGTESVR